jgi:subtilisin-like proprotein convertase family protein
MRAHFYLLGAILTMSCTVVGCGPASRDGGKGGPGGGGGADGGNGACTPTGPENTPATCSDGIDNDCNGLVDCMDPSCSGIGMCPVCGQVEHPEGTPIDLPDGVCGTNGNGNCTCSTDADCGSLQPAGQHCFPIGGGTNNCRISYTSTVNFSSFGSTQKLMQPSDIVSVCVNMSHEWARDLEIDLIAPSGEKLSLDKFEGQSCPTNFTAVCEVYLGHPVDTDSDGTGSPEEGMTYCWTPTSTQKSILGYADAGGNMNSWDGKDVEPDTGSNVTTASYAASDPWTKLVGATLNGAWTFAVTDLWPQDAGKLHSWTITFNAQIVQNCSTPPIQ